MQKSESKRDTSHLVRVERHILWQGRSSTRKIWVAGDNVRPDDKVLENAHNVRPYRYADTKTEEVTTSPYKPPRGPNVDAAHYRKAAALFLQILQIRNK